MWEVQIRNLGGPNYMRGGRVVDEDGKEIPGGGKGYRYVFFFGGLICFGKNRYVIKMGELLLTLCCFYYNY